MSNSLGNIDLSRDSDWDDVNTSDSGRPASVYL